MSFTSAATNASGYVPPEQQVIRFNEQQRQPDVVLTQQPPITAFFPRQEAVAVAIDRRDEGQSGQPRPDNSAVDYSTWPTKFVEVGCKFRKGQDGRSAVGACMHPGCKMTAEMYRLMCTGSKKKY